MRRLAVTLVAVGFGLAAGAALAQTTEEEKCAAGGVAHLQLTHKGKITRVRLDCPKIRCPTPEGETQRTCTARRKNIRGAGSREWCGCPKEREADFCHVVVTRDRGTLKALCASDCADPKQKCEEARKVVEKGHIQDQEFDFKVDLSCRCVKTKDE